MFNVVFHNRDDHAKNFSYLLSRSDQWQLSPAYDLTFSEGPRGEHQMDVCGEGNTPARRHLMELAGKTGVTVIQADSVIDRVTEVAGRVKEMAQDFPIGRKTLAMISAKIEASRSRMRRA